MSRTVIFTFILQELGAWQTVLTITGADLLDLLYLI